MNILFIGDIVGSPGRRAVKEILTNLKSEKKIDFCIANGENTAGGTGITYVIAHELYKMGIDVITMGNHTWAKKEIFSFVDSDPKIVRPANYSEGVPGKGSTVVSKDDKKLGVINVLGRIYMDNMDCPFKAVKREIDKIKKLAKVIVLDIHAEATSEKTAMAWFLDGEVSCVLGTHTHVQTADERILPNGTAYMTDVGMTGPGNGVIGVQKDIIIRKFLTNMPARFEVADGEIQFNAVYLEVDEMTGKTTHIERIFKKL